MRTEPLSNPALLVSSLGVYSRTRVWHEQGTQIIDEHESALYPSIGSRRASRNYGMEQSSFLSSLSFLLPLRSEAWPEKSSKSLLSDDEFGSFVVSIELLPKEEDASSVSTVDDTGATINHKASRPLFFADQPDPTLSAVQLVVASAEAEAAHADRKLVYMKIAEHISLVDAARSRMIEVQSEVYHPLPQYEEEKLDDSRTSQNAIRNHNRSIRLPPCLVIQFSVCQFRIFRNRTTHCRQDKEMLSAAYKTLTKAHFAPFALPLHLIASPARTSCSSSGTTINGQQRCHESSSSGTTATTETPSNEKNTGPAIDSNPKKRSASNSDVIDDEDDHSSMDGTSPSSSNKVRGRIQRCQKSRAEFIARLNMISDVLRYVPTCTDGSSSTFSIPTTLLSRTAESCAATYISSAEIEALECERAAEVENQEAMDAILNDFFPDRKADHHHQARKGQTSVEQSVKNMIYLLEERKRLMKEHHDIWLLPIRG